MAPQCTRRLNALPILSNAGVTINPMVFRQSLSTSQMVLLVNPDLTADAAKKVMNLHTTDGNVLVFNIHIANNKHEVIFPHSTTQLTGR